MSEQQPDQNAADEDVGSSVVAALYASMSRIFARYRQQWDTTKQMLGVEWELTIKCLWLALVFIIVFMSVVVVLWAGINALLAYALFAIATPVWGIALSILAVHILAIFVLTRTIKGVFSEIGFSRSLAVFKSVEGETQEVSTTQTGGV